MAILAIDRIRVQGQAKDKFDAIRQTGQLLVDSGCVMPEYVDGMLKREASMSTYLGNGVAIPHGEYDNLAHIKQTGIAVLQLPDGVLWEEDEKAHLIIGIAAQSDEHVNVLARLAEVVEDEEITAALVTTANAEDLLAALNAPPSDDD